jgi:hypothetical protein
MGNLLKTQCIIWSCGTENQSFRRGLDVMGEIAQDAAELNGIPVSPGFSACLAAAVVSYAIFKLLHFQVRASSGYCVFRLKHLQNRAFSG